MSARRSPDRSVHRWALAGATGGLVLALADFATSAGYLHESGDRVALGLRLLALWPALGGLVAAGLITLEAQVVARSSLPPWTDGWLGLLCAPAALALALDVFSGARASTLPGASWLLPTLLTVALVSAAVATRKGTRLVGPRLERAPFVARLLLGALLLGAAVAATQANRLLFPRHYDAIHGALAVISWALASLGAAALLPPREVSVPALALAAAAVVGVGATLGSLAGDHDGRAALLSPRASSTRPVLQAAAPALYAYAHTGPSEEAVRAARARRRAPPTDPSLPTWPEAHVVLVTIDALRADHLGAYGYERPISPALDALAEEGVVFERAWTTTPRSAWSLVSMLTGVSMRDRQIEGRSLVAPTLAERLGADGLHTAGLYPDGIFVHDGAPLERYRSAELFFSRRDAEYHDAASLTDVALAELDDLVARGEPQSFLWVHYFDVHEPYRERSLGDAPLDRYDGEIRNVDRAFARLRAGLAELRRPVVLWVSADHGEEHLDHGGRFHGDSLYEEQLRVPLLVLAPGLAPTRVATPVSVLDLAPTVYAGLELAPPSGLEGRDLRPWLAGRALEHPPIRAAEVGLRAVLRWPFKLIEDERVGGVQLFDLSADPGEQRSLASERPELIESLRADLAAFEE